MATNGEQTLQGYWLSRELIAWNPSLAARREAGDRLVLRCGQRSCELKPIGPLGDIAALKSRFPWLSHYEVLETDALVDFEQNNGVVFRDRVRLMLLGQGDQILYSTGIQLFGVLDELYAYTGDKLGVHFDSQQCPHFMLWAPTARSVNLRIYENGNSSRPKMIHAMNRENGVFTLAGAKIWKGLFYRYEVEVYNPRRDTIEKNEVVDPYSFSVSIDSRFSQIIDIHDSALKPAGWDKIRKELPESPVDWMIYELHLRDFSAMDMTVASELRGKYRAFGEKSSLGMAHLKALSDAGLTHVHLLPIFDFATLHDDPSDRMDPEIPVGLGPDSPVPQALISKLGHRDSYNWGYDPLLYFVPEGSYAVNPDGSSRIHELREMVSHLNDIGLGVVMDVVFNHTYSQGQGEHSIFDKIVPGYYYRSDSDGRTCTTVVGSCPDTATEHFMMGKLMRDAVVHWARHYKIDGFRFDLMGFHTKQVMKELRRDLDRLTLEKDGVDGRGIYLFGEGWKFGSLDSILPDQACTQWNLAGTGIGSFNDRIRDKVRGGNSSHDSRGFQGFATGLFYDDNGMQGIKPEDQKNRLHQFSDVIRVSLAGNLRTYKLKNWVGQMTQGEQIDADGTMAGYAAAPAESVNYVSCHDNYELWDQIAAKAPFRKPGRDPDTATNEERARMQRIALALVFLAQGVPFLSAGSDFLRSKSGDGDSYNSGDWFNRIDFGMSSNNWGIGLPNEEKNGKEWGFWAPRLREWSIVPTADQMFATAEFCRALMKIRVGSPLLRLRTPDQIQARLGFFESDLGLGQPPGFLSLHLKDEVEGLAPIDSARKRLIAVINATRIALTFSHESLKGLKLRVHPEWKPSFEPRVSQASFNVESGSFVVPPQTVMIYDEPR